MVLAEKTEPKTSYLKPETVKKMQIRRVVPTEEFVQVESEYEGKKESKMTGMVECQIESKPKLIWSMNNTSKNKVIDLFGGETKSWIGKTIQITIIPISGHDSVVVDEMGTQELNKKVVRGGSTLL